MHYFHHKKNTVSIERLLNLFKQPHWTQQGVSGTTTALTMINTPENNDMIGWMRKIKILLHVWNTVKYNSLTYCSPPKGNVKILNMNVTTEYILYKGPICWFSSLLE